MTAITLIVFLNINGADDKFGRRHSGIGHFNVDDFASPNVQSCRRKAAPVDNAGGTYTCFKSSRRNVWALIATTIVLSDINTAPTQAGRIKPSPASTPAASGSAMAL